MKASTILHILHRAVTITPMESFRRLFGYAVLTTPIVWGGDRSRVHVAPTAVVNNVYYNVGSGDIYIEDYAIFGHFVELITGLHELLAYDEARAGSWPKHGRDIVIEQGAWLANRVLVLGPCRIGRNAVVGAGSVVTHDVPPYTLVAGVPAKHIRSLRPDEIPADK